MVGDSATESCSRSKLAVVGIQVVKTMFVRIASWMIGTTGALAELVSNESAIVPSVKKPGRVESPVLALCSRRKAAVRTLIASFPSGQIGMSALHPVVAGTPADSVKSPSFPSMVVLFVLKT